MTVDAVAALEAERAQLAARIDRIDRALAILRDDQPAAAARPTPSATLAKKPAKSVTRAMSSGPATCPGCGREFRNDHARNVHRRRTGCGVVVSPPIDPEGPVPPRPHRLPNDPVLVCDDCGHQAPHAMDMNDHTIRAHARAATRNERTPRVAA